MKSTITFAGLASLLSAFANGSVTTNGSPIIGIFSQPTTNSNKDCGGDCLYIAASYVKFVEAAGARVVPVNYYASNDELDYLFENLNGFLFTGGGSSFPKAAQYIFDKTVSANDQGDFSPLWGTCMGFQWLLIAASRDQNILDGVFDSYNYSIPLDFTDSAKSSRMFGQASTYIMDVLANQDVTMNNHHYGIYTKHFEETESLSEFYNMLSTNKDRSGVEFVSTMEAFKYPIYGVQWHPEKNAFEWELVDGQPYEAINHSADAIAVEQYTANFLVSEARKSTHTFDDKDEEESLLIYNYPKSRSGPDFVESYFFEKDFSAFNNIKK